MVPWWLLAIAPMLAATLAAHLPIIEGQATAEKPSYVPGAFFAAMVLAMIFSIPGLSKFNPLLGPARRNSDRAENALDRLANSPNPSNHVPTHGSITWGGGTGVGTATVTAFKANDPQNALDLSQLTATDDGSGNARTDPLPR